MGKDREFWLPLQELSGNMSIKSKVDLGIEKIRICLEGISKVCTRKLNNVEFNRFNVGMAKYKFLSQHYEMKDFERSIDRDNGIIVYSAHFSFTISRLALTKGSGVPQQCLSLPPSFRVGQTLSDDDDFYAQPNISYSLVVNGTARTMDGSRMVSLKDEREILIHTPTEIQPPLETSDFPGEFVESQAHTWHLSVFDRDTYQMTLSTMEPPAVILQRGTLMGSTTLALHIRIEGPNPGSTTGHALQNFVQYLPKIRFKTLIGLHIKTFYSTRPFARFPCQKLLTVDSPICLQDQVMSLGEQNHSANSWTGPLSPCTGSKSLHTLSTSQPPSDDDRDYSGIWRSSLNLLFTVPGDLLPTFCSALASRQHSLIVRIRINGIRIDKFILEVPLQIVFSPDEPPTTGLQTVETSSTSEGYEGNFTPNRPQHFGNIFTSLKVSVGGSWFQHIMNR
ncbi:uncharacterized protein Z518_08710 [Rhinocladiella mackenziei CBS 650.93]|uniref:Arrestin-like N-terminal domain-containing protein n=1 Tax=Rhinocladiella mackenziei CBS 650.93 TaxID=1442369 RepID=A0A0D2GX21_9EURO|nr:uncharacterized protein Z518_08710 [Rhinocladiella mackenziei CBS 650.93]KIX02768.1 hypothetical protein Z518_08710 [Rhinocladiella mackenziei CBS 650.93]